MQIGVLLVEMQENVGPNKASSLIPTDNGACTGGSWTWIEETSQCLVGA